MTLCCNHPAVLFDFGFAVFIREEFAASAAAPVCVISCFCAGRCNCLMCCQIMTKHCNFLRSGLFAGAASECLHAFCSACRFFGYDSVVPLMAFCRNLFLCHKYFITYRAMLAFSQTCLYTAWFFCRINDHCVAFCRDHPAVFFDFGLAFGIAEELAASITAPVCTAARFCAGRCYCLMGCQIMAECRNLFRPGLFADAAGECLHALCSACRFFGHDTFVPLMTLCSDHPAVFFYFSLSFSITEELTASLTAPVCVVACFCAGRCDCLMGCQIMAKRRNGLLCLQYFITY